MDLAELSALEIAAAVRAGDISAKAVALAAIARIEAVDDEINAVVVRDFDRALDAAAEIDRRGAKADPRPLVGVAMTVKESNDVAGLPSTWGFEHCRNNVADKDAVVVERLKAAGAVILGKTNAPVALADWQSANPIYGRTVNPLDLARSPGGSSGGASAALAAGMTPLEIGSDIGGSIRVPAHFCGVFGHKPTWGLVPAQGHGFPGTDGVDTPLAVVGPMARTAADLSAALRIIQGPAAAGLSQSLPGPRLAGVEGLRIKVLKEHPLAKASRAIQSAITALADGLATLGAEVEDFSPPLSLEQMHEDYVAMLTTIISRGTEDARGTTAHEWMELVDRQMRATRAWSELFETADIVLAPVLGMTAFPHDDEPNWRLRSLTIDGEAAPFGAQLAYPGLATFPALPATAIPVGRDEDGLPIGVQAIGAPWRDYTTLAFAEAVEGAGLTI